MRLDPIEVFYAFARRGNVGYQDDIKEFLFMSAITGLWRTGRYKHRNIALNKDDRSLFDAGVSYYKKFVSEFSEEKLLFKLQDDFLVSPIGTVISPDDFAEGYPSELRLELGI